MLLRIKHIEVKRKDTKIFCSDYVFVDNFTLLVEFSDGKTKEYELKQHDDVTIEEY